MSDEQPAEVNRSAEPGQDPDEVTVRDNVEQARYEAVHPDGTVVGLSQYERRGDVVVFTHTEVDDAVEGQGVGSTLVREALTAVRESGLSVRPLCPFVKEYLDRHPELAAR